MVRLEESVEKFMRMAIEAAREGIKGGEGGPFGATIVCGDEVVAVAHNTVLKDGDPTAHAEINAIRAASKKKGISLEGCEIFSTVEPCPMCFAAIHWARIPVVVFGAGIEDAAGHGFNEIPLTNEEIVEVANLRTKIVSGLLKKECVQLLRDYDKLEGKKY